MRYTFNPSGWKYKEHFWFAWRPVVVYSSTTGRSTIVWREWVMRQRRPGDGPRHSGCWNYRDLMGEEVNQRIKEHPDPKWGP